MAKKENKKSAIPEQFSNIDKIDINKELTNAGFSGVNAPQMTAKTDEQIGQAAQRDLDIDKADWERLTAPNANGAFDPTQLSEEDFARFTQLRNKYPDFQYGSRIDTTPANVAENKGQVVEALTGSVEEGDKARAEQAATVNPNTLTYDTEGNVTGTGQTADNSAPEFGPGDITGNKAEDEKTAVSMNKANQRFKIKSIMQAYYDGDFGDPESEGAKANRDYLLVDSFAKAARNISKDLANISAAYTGGSINNNPNEESLWSQRNKEVTASGIESEKAGIEGSREWREAQMDTLNRKALTNEVLNAEDRRNMAKLVKSYLYDENNKLKYDPNDATFKALMNEYTQLMNGSAVGGSTMKNFIDKLITELGV